jgi:hypothetical protein
VYGKPEREEDDKSEDKAGHGRLSQQVPWREMMQHGMLTIML